MLKRAHKDSFHKISPKHLERHIEDFAGRQNVRKPDTIQQMASIAKGLLNKRLNSAYLIVNAQILEYSATTR